MKIINRFKKATALVVVGLLMFGLVPSISYAAEEHVFTKVISNNNLHFGFKSDGTIWGWGNNTYGQLGDGTKGYNRAVPTQVKGLTDVVDISIGNSVPSHTIALKSDGTVWTWGDNTNGQLGNKRNFLNHHTPTQLVELTDVVSIKAAGSSSYALKSDGTVWAWGKNNYGQLGDGTKVDKTIPTKIEGLSDVVSIKASGNSAYAIKSDGTVWVWGYNFSRQLGDGTMVDKTVPIQTVGLSDITKIEYAGMTVLARKSDGTLWGWGDGRSGQLGPDGKLTYVPTPIQIELPVESSDIKKITTHGSSVYVLTTNGDVWAWGGNSYGVLGDGSTMSRSVPSKIAALNNVVDISISLGNNGYLIALKSDGTVWAWGYNSYGQLGNGSNSQFYVPTQISSMADIASIWIDRESSFAISSDGSLWSWGYNYYGQLGDGTTANKMVPTLSPYIKILPIEEEPESDIEKATEAVLKAETTKLQSDVNDARILVNELTDEAVKQNLSARLDALQAEIDSKNENARKLAEATNAVTNAETTKLQADLDSARALVNALEASSEKTALNERLNTLQIYILQLKLQELIDKIEELINSGNLTGTDMKEIEDAWGEIEDVVNQIPDGAEKEEITEQLKVKEAETAVIKAELSKLQTDVDSARVLVNALPEGADKTALTERLDVVQTQIDESLEGEDETEEPVPTNTPSAITAAEKKLKIAETYKRDPYIANAEEAINALIDSPEKTAMLERIESLKTSVEDEQLQKLIKAVGSKVAIAEKYKKESYINSAREILEQLPDGAEKEAFDARLDALEEKAPTDGASSSASAVKVAARATERAEKSPTRYSIVYADKKTSALTDATPEKVGLVERVAVLKAQYQGTITEQNAEKAITNAVRYVELAEKYKNNYYFTKAEGLVSSLTDGDSKTTLSSRLEALRPVVYPSAEQTLIDEAVKAVESAEKYPSNTAYVSRAVKAVGLLPEGQIKTNLLERLGGLTVKAA